MSKDPLTGLPDEKPQLFFSIDIETNGRGPAGACSILQIGSAAFFPTSSTPVATFLVNLLEDPLLPQDPETMEWWKGFPEVWDEMMQNRKPFRVGIKLFYEWIVKTAEDFGATAVAASWPAAWDGAHVYRAFWCTELPSPFGHSALDIKTLAMAYLGGTYRSLAKYTIPEEWREGCLHTHNALDDAIEQGKIMVHLMQRLSQLRLAPTGLQALDRILSSDFCEELEYDLAIRPEVLSSRERQMAELIGQCYRLAHSHCGESICFGQHESWRNEAKTILKGKSVEDNTTAAVGSP